MEYLRSPRIPENLRFISVEEIEQMRHDQEAAMIAAGSNAINAITNPVDAIYHGADVRDAAHQQIKQEFDDAAELYVATHLNRDDNEELFDGCVDLVRRYSILNMSDSEWRAGVQDTDGSYNQPETAGQRRLFVELEALVPEHDDSDDDEDEPDSVDAAEIARLQGELEIARGNLAQISIKRRGKVRSKGKKAHALRQQYDIAQDAYNQALVALGTGAVEQLRADGVSDEQVAQMVIFGTIHEKRAFTEAEAAAMEQDNSRSARFMRLYGKLPVMIGMNTVLGAGIGMGARKLAKYGFLAAFPVAGIAAFAGIRAGKALLTSSVAGRLRLSKSHQKRGEQDIKALTNLFEADTPQRVAVPSGAGVDADQYALLSQRLVEQSIDQRVVKDVNGNRWRAALSATLAGGAALGGALLVDKSGWFHGSKDMTIPKPKIDPEIQDAINKDPAAFERMVSNPEQFEKFMNGVREIKGETGFAEGSPELAERVHNTLALAEHMSSGSAAVESGQDALRALPLFETASTFTIPHGGGIIRDVIRPMAQLDGHSLSAEQESQVWQALKLRFGDNLFVDTPVGSHGADQWVMRSGQATIRPEVVSFLKDQITLAK